MKAPSVAILLCVCLWASQAFASNARALFLRGELPGGGHTQPCAGCHGLDGGGRREGGLQAPALDTESLTDRASASGYDAGALARLLSDGRTPDGRNIDRVMPRIVIDAPLADELLGILGSLRAEDSAGVEQEDIHIGVFAARADDALPALFAAAVVRWSDGGQIFGRRILVEPVNEADLRRRASSLFAIVGLTAAQREIEAPLTKNGLLNLFPRHPFEGDEDADRNRGLTPDFTALGQALGAAASECGSVSIDDDDARRAPSLFAAMKRELKPGPTMTRKCRIALGGVPLLAADEHLIAPLDVVAGRLDEIKARPAGATLIDIRPASSEDTTVEIRALSDAQRFADAGALVLVDGLIRAGRRLTRSRFMQALDTAVLAPPGWRRIDYRQYRLSGVVETNRIELGAGAARH